MKIKHYIVIRFYSSNMMDKEKLFDTSLLLNGVKVFKQYLLKSLENQNNKNFEIILMIHDEININNDAIKELYNIKSSLNINVLRMKDLDKFINKNRIGNDFLIITRVDHDDLIINTAVNDIQHKVNINIPLFYYGYCNGCTMINNDINNVYEFFPRYNGNGSISIFQSLIINQHKINEFINIYKLGPHTNQKETFINILKEHNFKFYENMFNIDTVNYLQFIYIKHNFNHSSLIDNNLENNWHRTDIKVDKPKEWFIERFGNFID